MEDMTISQEELDNMVAEALEGLSPNEEPVLSPSEEARLNNVVEEQIQERFKRNLPPIDESVSRFSSAEWFDLMRTKDITLAGLGGIGSYTAFLLGRLKPNKLYLYDPDRVEQVNMSGQLYGINNINHYKGIAISKMIREYCDYHSMHIYAENFTLFSPVTPILICGFDNMNARKDAFENWERNLGNMEEEQLKEALFIDGRLDAESFQVFCMTGEDLYYRELYRRNWLFNDSEAEATICSYKQTSFCANMIASVMVNLLVNHISNLGDSVIKRELPFKTFYDASLMRFITE